MSDQEQPGHDGDLGLSSERRGPFHGVEGTGSQASAQHATDGASPTVRDADGRVVEPDDEQPVPDKPDETARISGVDRTVGEVQPDPVADKHAFDPGRNPRH